MCIYIISVIIIILSTSLHICCFVSYFLCLFFFSPFSHFFSLFFFCSFPFLICHPPNMDLFVYSFIYFYYNIYCWLNLKSVFNMLVSLMILYECMSSVAPHCVDQQLNITRVNHRFSSWYVLQLGKYIRGFWEGARSRCYVLGFVFSVFRSCLSSTQMFYKYKRLLDQS